MTYIWAIDQASDGLVWVVRGETRGGVK